MSFYDFASWYVKCFDQKTLTERAYPRIRLVGKFNDIVMRKRNKPAVLRIPTYNLNSEDYF